MNAGVLVGVCDFFKIDTYTANAVTVTESVGGALHAIDAVVGSLTVGTRIATAALGANFSGGACRACIAVEFHAGGTYALGAVINLTLNGTHTFIMIGITRSSPVTGGTDAVACADGAVIA